MMAHLEKCFPVRPLRVNYFLPEYQKYVWSQDDMYMAENRLAGPVHFGATGRKKFKHPSIIKEIL